MTDPKGDRSLRPHQQPDPDVFVHVTKTDAKGITVRGAKLHQTGALNSHEIIVMPTMAMREDDKAFAVSFAIPADTKGITYILGRQAIRDPQGGAGHHGSGQRGLRRPGVHGDL
jgi:4-hydroxybutyryl-CoA dehydratase/vinylacetyl-CoA-Delta-isomerase